MVIARQKESNLLKYNVAGDCLAIKLEGDLKSRTKYFEQIQFWGEIFRTHFQSSTQINRSTSSTEFSPVHGVNFVRYNAPYCGTKSLDRIAQNPLVEESISHNRLNPAWDRFPTPLTVVRPSKSSV